VKTIVLAALSSLVLGAALGGCAPAMTFPPGFIEPGTGYRGAFTQRAVSADGVVLALRTEENPKGATLEFWTSAVRDELVTRRGYKLAKEEAVSSADGTPGTLMTFSAQRSGVDFTYLAAVYVKGSQVAVGEGGGKTEAVAPKMEAMRKCLTGLRTGSV